MRREEKRGSVLIYDSNNGMFFVRKDKHYDGKLTVARNNRYIENLFFATYRVFI